MANLTRVFVDAECTTVPLVQAKIRALDENTRKLINGDGGGTWSPTSKIVVGGAGVVLLGDATFTAANSGIRASDAAPLVHGRPEPDDYVWFDSTRWHEVLSLVSPAVGQHMHVVQDQITTPFGGAETRRHGSRWFSALRVHDGAKIFNCTLLWQVQTSRSAVPEHRPRMRVVRVSQDGIIEPLRVASDTDSDGFIVLGSNASTAAYVQSNQPQTAVYTVNQTARSIVDSARYRYMAEFVEESGVGAFALGPEVGNRFFVIRTLHSNVRHMGPQ